MAPGVYGPGVRFHRSPLTPAALAYLDLPGSSGTDVFVGGLGAATTVSFAEVADHPALHGRRRILVDLPGSGWSDHDDAFAARVEDHAAAIAHLLDSLGVSRVRLIGHSLGGSIVIALAAARPDLVGRLVVVEPNLDPGVGGISTVIAAYSEDGFVAEGHATVVAETLAEAEGGDDGSAEYARTLRRWSSVTLHRTAVSLLADRAPTFRELLATAPMPRLYISGALSEEDLAAVEARGCAVRVVPTAAHVVMQDNLEGFIAALGD